MILFDRPPCVNELGDPHHSFSNASKPGHSVVAAGGGGAAVLRERLAWEFAVRERNGPV